MIFDIPGFRTLDIQHIVFDYNGTLAVDGTLITGLRHAMQELPQEIKVHVLTADTYGSVAAQLEGVNCVFVTIGKDAQDEAKVEYVNELGAQHCLAVGNGRNDHLMLEQAGLGVALLQEEGLATRSLLAADIVCSTIFDVFAYFKVPERLIATLRN